MGSGLTEVYQPVLLLSHGTSNIARYLARGSRCTVLLTERAPDPGRDPGPISGRRPGRYRGFYPLEPGYPQRPPERARRGRPFPVVRAGRAFGSLRAASQLDASLLRRR